MEKDTRLGRRTCLRLPDIGSFPRRRGRPGAGLPAGLWQTHAASAARRPRRLRPKELSNVVLGRAYGVRLQILKTACNSLSRAIRLFFQRLFACHSPELSCSVLNEASMP